MKFQSYAFGQNHFQVDSDLHAILDAYWPEWKRFQNELDSFGQFAGNEVMEAAYHIDHDAPPILVMHDLDGNRVDRVRVSPSQQAILPRLLGINRPPHEGGSWHHHFALGYLVADPGLYCIVTITGQTVYAIEKYAPEHKEWVAKMLRGEAFGATWMTEVQGGSDLGANTVSAHLNGEVWRLNGEKYFTSGAGLTDLALVSARPEGAPGGPKGLALFLVPRLNREGGLNYHVRRLKDKSATRAVPSGEVEFADTEAFLVGAAKDGIYYTLENLTVSRLANAVAAMGIAKKAQLEVLGRVQHRETFGKRLVEHPLIRRDLVDLAVRMAAGAALAFHAVDAFDKAWHERPPYSPAYHYARFLSHLAKNRTAEHAAFITATAMELFGGLGFLEEYAVARWHREALITPIWEGPSNIQALDLLEAMQKKQAHEPFLAEFLPMLRRADTDAARLAADTMERTVQRLASLRNPEEAQWHAKHALTTLADAAQIGLLYRLAETGGPRYAHLAELYAAHFLRHEEYPAAALDLKLIGMTGFDA